MGNLRQSKQAGFTLVELIIVIVAVGVLSAYAAMKHGSAGLYTLLSQAQTMASDIRHAQALATTLGVTLRISVSAGVNGSYSVSCLTATTSPCNATANTPMTNPVTGSAFTVSLQKNVSLSGPATLDINSMGKPTAAGTYGLTADSTTVNVNLAAVTGMVDVQ